MISPEDRTKLVRQLTLLAKENLEPQIIENVDPAQLENALDQMSDNVVDNIINLDESERMIVAMATITKLLVENFVLQQARQNV